MQNLSSIFPLRLFVLICLLLSLSSVKAKPVLVEGILAIVNNQPVLLSEFNRLWENFRNNLENVNTNEINALKQRTLDELILVQLQLEQADRLGIRVSQRELNGYIEQIAQNNQLSLKQLYQQLEKDGQTTDQFRKNIRNQVTIRLLQQRLFANSIQVSTEKIDAELQKELTINDPHEYQYQVLLVEKPEAPNSKAKPYKKIKAIQKRLKDRLSFEQAIAIYSDLPIDKNRVLNWLDTSSIPDNFHDFLISAKINEVSPTIKTERGIFLLKLIAKRNKRPIEKTRYKLQLITLSHLSYDKQSARKIYELFLKSSSKRSRNILFARMARDISQDQFAINEGNTDWLVKDDVPLKLANKLDEVKPNKVHFLETDDGWLIYQVLKHEKFDASKSLLRQQIHQQLINQEMTKNYPNYLRNLRKNSSIEVLAKFSQ